MQYKRFNDTWMLRIDKGEEVIQSLTAMCEKEDIRLAEVSAIGAADYAAIGVYDLGTGTYHKEELPFHGRQRHPDERQALHPPAHHPGGPAE